MSILPKGVTLDHQARLIKNIESSSIYICELSKNDPAIETRIAQYQLALKMHPSVPQLTDFTKERRLQLICTDVLPAMVLMPPTALWLVNLWKMAFDSYNYQCGWDHHGNIEGSFPNAAKPTDKATAALIVTWTNAAC